MPKFLGLDSNRGFLRTLGALPAACGAGAGFLPVPLALGRFIETSGRGDVRKQKR